MRVKWVAELREEMGLTRYAFARLLGVPPQSIDHLETKGEAIKMALLVRIQEVSGWSPEKIFKKMKAEVSGKKVE